MPSVRQPMRSSSYWEMRTISFMAMQVLLGASKVIGPCNNSNNEVPRSRVTGFDIEQNRIILFGGCRPNADGQPLVVNYYYWVITQCGDGIVQSDGSASG